MHEVRRENDACSHRARQARLRSARVRMHEVQQCRPVHRGIRDVFAVGTGRQGQLGRVIWPPRFQSIGAAIAILSKQSLGKAAFLLIVEALVKRLGGICELLAVVGPLDLIICALAHVVD